MDGTHTEEGRSVAIMDGMRKPLPSRPSQDLGYSPPSSLPASQFGRQNEDEDRPPTSNGRNPPVNQSPNAAVILDGYRNEILSGVEGKPLYNPVSTWLPPRVINKGSGWD